MADACELLVDATVGAERTVSAIAGGGRTATRLRELGLTPGAQLRVVRRAPLGSALVVQVRGGALALRRDEAALVQLQPAEPRGHG